MARRPGNHRRRRVRLATDHARSSRRLVVGAYTSQPSAARRRPGAAHGESHVSSGQSAVPMKMGSSTGLKPQRPPRGEADGGSMRVASTDVVCEFGVGVRGVVM